MGGGGDDDAALYMARKRKRTPSDVAQQTLLSDSNALAPW